MRGLVSRQLLGVVLSLDIALQPLWALAADGAVASTAANAATQVTQAPNGVEVIQIADPNAAGVSHNLFQDYQVGPQGQVLNNSTTDVRSKLAGTIEGNSQLQHGPARIILNEVTGSNPSSLLGVTEVAGQAASLVIANPNGITCSGCGFLNTPRVTLGTGRPLWQEGQLTGLAVDTGILEIGQEGLLGGNLEQLELLAKQIVLYGQVVSPDLTLAAGSLKFNYADGRIEQRGVLPGSVLPYLAIDASALGAMYANQIALVATDNGVGVNVEGPMAAYTGSIHIDANGDVRASDVQAQQNLTIETQGKVTLDKALANSIDINTTDAVQLNSTLAAQEQLSVQAKSIQNLGTVSAGYRPDGSFNSAASLSVTTKGKADNQGQWLSAGSLSIEAADLTNSAGAMISGREGLSLTASAGSNRGELNSLGALTLTIDGLWDNQVGRVQTAGQLTLNADAWNNRQGHTQAAGLSAQIESSLTNSQGEVVTTQGNLILDAAELINQQGVLQSQSAVTVTANNLDNTQGSVTAKGGETSKLTLDGTLTNGGGTVAIASNKTNLNAKILDQSAKSSGQASGALEFTGSGAVDITAEQINNVGGKIVGSGTSLTLKARELNNQNGTLRSGPAPTKPQQTSSASTTPAATSSQLTLALSGDLNNQQGRVLSDNLNLSAASLDNRAGYIDAQGTQGKTNITISGDVNNQNGTVFSKQHDLSLQAANWQNAQGQIGHLGSGVFTLNAQQMDNTAGKVQTFGGAQWQLGGWNNTQGVVSIRGDGDANSVITLSEDWINEQGRLLVGGQDFTFTARTVHNNGLDGTQGIWHSGSGAWALTAETLTNTAGKIGSAGDLKLTLNQLENAGELQAHQLTLKANSATNGGGITLSGTAANSLDAQVQGDWLNQNGKITLAGGGLITANRWDNTNGQLLSAGAITLTAQGGDTNQASFLNKNGWLQADGGLTLTTASTLDNRQGKLLSGGDTVLTSQADINNSGGTIDLTPAIAASALPPTLTITAQAVLDNSQGVLQSFSQGQHTLSASHINNTQGLIYSDAQNLTANAGTVDNTAGRWQHSGQTLEIKGLDEWNNSASADTAALLQTDGNLVVQGFNRILNSGQVGEAPSTIRARSAQLQGKRVENLNGAQLALVATEKSATEKPATAPTDSDASLTPQAFASLPPVESSLQLDQLVNQGRIFTQASLNLSDAHLLNTGGEFSSFSDLTLNAGDLGTLGGKLWADGILTLASNSDFTFANQVQLDAGKGVVWDVKGVFTNQGTLASGTNVTLKANVFTNTADADLSALGTLALEVTQTVTNQGRIRGSGDTHVQANSLENHGLISAKQALNVTAGTSITNTDTLFATGDLTALAPEMFNTSTPSTTASIWAGGKLVLAGGKASDGATPLVGKQLINTSGSIQTYKAGDIELWFSQVTNQAAAFELKPERIRVKQWFTTGSGKPADEIQDGEFDLTISELLGLMDRSGNQVPYSEHNLYVFQPTVVVSQPRINSGGSLLIQTLNDPKSAQGECSGAPCEPALIRNEGGSLSAVGDLKIEAGYVPGANIEAGVGSRVDNANLYLPGEITKESNQFINVIPDPGVAYTDIARFSNMGTFTLHFGQDAPRAVEKAATLHTGTIIAGGELTAHVEKVENGEKATYQAASTGPAITGDAPPPMDFSQGAPFSRVTLTNTGSQQADSTERTQLDPALANPDGLGSSVNSEITLPAQPQVDPTQAREARIYNPLQNLVLPNNGYLYKVDIKGSSPYVVQAADLLKPPTDKPGETPISSDYFFTQLGYDPEQIGRRLGDSFYETELVRQAIINTRGVRFVTDPRTGLAIDSDEAQYRYLLDNALEAQKDLQLAVGTALTPEQIRALTQDIVWLERHEMAGQEVWVPVYYATGVDPSQMVNGAVMAGQSVRVVSEELLNKGDIRGLSLVDVNSQTSQNFGAIGSLDRLIVKSQTLDNKGLMLGKTTQVSGFDIDNSGQMIARETLDVTADNELNNRGELAGSDVNAKSTGGDVINQGQINASNTVDLDAARDILLKPGQAAAINAGGNLTATAGRDVSLAGQTINTRGDATISATRDVAITPTTEQIITSSGNTTTHETRNTATKIATGGSLSIDAGRDLGITATKIDTGKNVTLNAERDLNLTSAADRTHTEGQGKRWHTIETDVKQVTTDINAGGNIDATAGRDINFTAVKGEAGGDIHLNAERDTNLLGAVDSEYDYSYEKKKKSYGRSKTKESESLAETAQATELSAGGNLLLNTKLSSKGEILKETGQRINTEGAKLRAGDPEAAGETQGTIAAYAADGITLAGQTTKSLDYSETRRSGTLGLSKKAKGNNTGEDHSSATTLSSTGDTQLLSDHNLTLEGVVADVDGDMTLSAVDDLRVTPGETHTQTQTWNNKSGAFSGGSLYRKTEVNNEDGTTGLTDSALLVGGNLTVEAGSTEILGTRIQTGSKDSTGNFTATVDSGNLNIGAAQASTFHKDSTLDVRLNGVDTLKTLKEPHKIIENDDGRAKIKLGSATYLNADNSKTTLDQQGSEVTTFGDITLDATSIGGKTNVAGSSLEATGTIDLHGTQDLALSSVDETTTERHKTQEGKGEASVVVQHQAVEVAKAAKNVLDAKEQLSDAKRQLKQYENNLDTQQSQLNQLRADLAAGTPGVTADDVQLLSELVRDLEDDRAWYQTGLALATVNLTSATTALLQQSAAAGASTSTWGFNAGLQLDLSASEATSETFNSTSVGSTLKADRIILSTGSKNADGSLNTLGTQLDMQGADIDGRDVIITTGTLNASSREDTKRQSSQSKQGQLSGQVTIYGAAGGASVNGSFQRAESESQSTTVHNTHIQANTLNITTSGDANFEGATTRAEEKLTVDVGGNLTLDSQQNRSSSKTHEQGMSAGVGFGGDGEQNQGNAFTKNIQTGKDVGSASSTNAGISQGNSRSRTQDTVVTSLTSGGTADIKVKGNTHLGGAIIGTLDKVDVCTDKNSKACKTEQVSGRDLNQLSFTTGSLTFNDLLNLDTSTSSSFGLSTNLSLGNGQDTQPANPRVSQNTAKTAKGDALSPTSSTVSLANSNHNTATKTLSTLGHGNITVGGVELEKDGQLTAAGTDAAKSGVLKGLNRDTEKTEKALWDSHQEMQVDASVDHRLFTEEGHEQIKNDAVDTAEFGGDIAAATHQVVEQEDLGALDFWHTLDDNTKATQVKHDLLRNPEYSWILEGLKSDKNGDVYAQALQGITTLAQQKYGMSPDELSSLYLYNSKETSSVSLGDTSIADVKGGIVLEGAHNEFGNLFLDVSDGSAKTDHLISLGHEVYESTTLVSGRVNDDKQELFADNFGNRLSTRLDQAAGGNLDATGGRSFNTSLLNSQSVQLGTLHANTVGDILVDHRQLGGKELTAIKNMAPDYAKKKGVSLEQARKELTQQALRMVDKTWSEQAHIEENADARNFLLTNTDGQNFVIGGHFEGLVGGEITSLFTSTDAQFNDKYLLANEATDNELGKFKTLQFPYEVTPVMLSDYDLKGWLERYATADGTRPVGIKDVTAGDYAEQIGKDSLVAGTFIGKQVIKTEIGLTLDLLGGVYSLGGKAVSACQREGASCLLPSTDTHGSAGDKANIDSLTGNKDAFIRNSTFAGYSTAFDLANIALLAYPFGLGGKVAESAAGELLLVNEAKAASNKLGDLSPGVLAEADFGYLNQSAKSLVDDSIKKAEITGIPDFYVGPAGPEATLQGTGYRYMRLYNDDGTVNKYALTTLDLNAAPVTYFGFEKFESGVAARDAFQIKGPELGDSWSDARLVGTFDTLQLFDAKGTPTVRHPYFAGDDISTGKIEPFTEAYPQYGKGGVEQITADRQEVKFHTLDILPAELMPDVKKSVPTLLNVHSKKSVAGGTTNTTSDNSIVELFTDVRGAQIPGALGVGPNDLNAVAADARSMSNIASNSKTKVVASNPYIPKSAGGTFTMMDYLPEASRITRPGGEIVINGTAANKYLTNLPTQSQLDALGLEIKYKGSLLPEYQSQTYQRADGSKLTEPMETIVFIKKK